ncbi:barstar family protein [Streptomyces sp. ST2-7A]|uniref:barstar family protein n=1 Tax=Streptomyces sp. ST2-7A TaxID=2907214 RepID=UPI001F1587FE|nr:barstar family protein [Streptomyces sp. ST2-7A]MCE7083534.1 barstar family protein [Streptomyces sp. ST2-7A]
MTTPRELPEPFERGVAALLRGDLPPGLHRLPSSGAGPDGASPAATARAMAEEAGWWVLPFSAPDGDGGRGGTGGGEGPGRTKELLIEEFATTFRFPAGTGRNWDALADLLTDLAWLPPARGRLMLAAGWSEWCARDPDAPGIAESILEEAVEYWSGRAVPFAVLLG